MTPVPSVRKRFRSFEGSTPQLALDPSTIALMGSPTSSPRLCPQSAPVLNTSAPFNSSSGDNIHTENIHHEVDADEDPLACLFSLPSTTRSPLSRGLFPRLNHAVLPGSAGADSTPGGLPSSSAMHNHVHDGGPQQLSSLSPSARPPQSAGPAPPGWAETPQKSPSSAPNSPGDAARRRRARRRMLLRVRRSSPGGSNGALSTLVGAFDDDRGLSPATPLPLESAGGQWGRDSALAINFGESISAKVDRAGSSSPVTPTPRSASGSLTGFGSKRADSWCATSDTGLGSGKKGAVNRAGVDRDSGVVMSAMDKKQSRVIRNREVALKARQAAKARLAMLESENSSLRRKVSTLESENASLRSQIVQIRARFGANSISDLV